MNLCLFSRPSLLLSSPSSLPPRPVPRESLTFFWDASPFILNTWLFFPYKRLDTVFPLPAIHAIVSHSSATILVAHFHLWTNLYGQNSGSTTHHAQKYPCWELTPEDSELQHHKITLAKSISLSLHTRSLPVTQGKFTFFISELRSRQGHARLPSLCWSHSPCLAVPTHVALSIPWAPAHLRG